MREERNFVRQRWGSSLLAAMPPPEDEEVLSTRIYRRVEMTSVGNRKEEGEEGERTVSVGNGVPVCVVRGSSRSRGVVVVVVGSEHVGGLLCVGRWEKREVGKREERERTDRNHGNPRSRNAAQLLRRSRKEDSRPLLTASDPFPHCWRAQAR